MVVLASVEDSNVSIVVGVTKDLIAKVQAGKIVGAVAQAVGGCRRGFGASKGTSKLDAQEVQVERAPARPPFWVPQLGQKTIIESPTGFPGL